MVRAIKKKLEVCSPVNYINIQTADIQNIPKDATVVDQRLSVYDFATNDYYGNEYGPRM